MAIGILIVSASAVMVMMAHARRFHVRLHSGKTLLGACQITGLYCLKKRLQVALEIALILTKSIA